MNRSAFQRAVAAVVLAGATAAQALINPNFTPVQLVASAETIMALKAPVFDDQGKAAAEVREVLKQPPDAAAARTVTLDLKYARKEHSEDLKRRIEESAGQLVLLFFGKGENGEDLGLLHTSGKWIEIDRTRDVAGSWDVLSLDARSGSQGMGMEATWAGDSAGLMALVRLLIANPDMGVPSGADVMWQDHLKIGTVTGRIGRMMGVDLTGAGTTALYVASDAGDRIYAFDARARRFAEISARLKLACRSTLAAWGDFNGDGRLDLASWDGSRLSIAAQAADGTFATRAVAGMPAGGCAALQALDVGVAGMAGLAWGSARGAALLLPDREDSGLFAQRALLADAALLAAMGAGGKLLVADFDGDALADVLQFGVNAGILYKGKGGGGFEAGQGCAVSTGTEPMDAFLGDYDGNGLPDVFTVSDDGCRLWQNEGKGLFAPMIGYSGEVGYISQPKAICGNTCDINNDGRQDIFIAYSARNAPQIFFNRLFRSFGHAHQPIDITESQALPEALNGQQAGVVADLTHDGAQDMAFALLTGEIYVFPRDPDMGSCRAARVSLPAVRRQAGPVTVMGDNGLHSLGAWVVQPGVSEAFLGRPGAGALNVSWQLPGQPRQRRTVTLEDKVLRLDIP